MYIINAFRCIIPCTTRKSKSTFIVHARRTLLITSPLCTWQHARCVRSCTSQSTTAQRLPHSPAFLDASVVPSRWLALQLFGRGWFSVRCFPLANSASVCPWDRMLLPRWTAFISANLGLRARVCLLFAEIYLLSSAFWLSIRPFVLAVERAVRHLLTQFLVRCLGATVSGCIGRRVLSSVLTADLRVRERNMVSM